MLNTENDPTKEDLVQKDGKTERQKDPVMEAGKDVKTVWSPRMDKQAEAEAVVRAELEGFIRTLAGLALSADAMESFRAGCPGLYKE